MKISIITPSFRNSEWLKLCVASVADQRGVEVEHIVQDACSDDGTQDWLPADPRVKAYIEKDGGMYDAVNRGFRRATGDVLAYLNCDEQYLPGALAAVVARFQEQPATDILVADTVIIDGDGGFICCRKCLKPWRGTVWLYNPTITSSIFLHRRVLDQHGLFFDTTWRDVGDLFWMIAAVDKKLNFSVLRRYTSVFADTGENMNLKPNAQRERRKKFELMPGWVRRFRWPLLQLHHVRRLFRGVYFERPFSYSIYTRKSPGQRVDFSVPKPVCIWRSRLAPQPA